MAFEIHTKIVSQAGEVLEIDTTFHSDDGMLHTHVSFQGGEPHCCGSLPGLLYKDALQVHLNATAVSALNNLLKVNGTVH